VEIDVNIIIQSTFTRSYRQKV